MCQVEGKTEVEGFVAFHIQRHPPIPPGRPAKDGQLHLEATAQVQGVGVGQAAECPRTKTPPGASSEVTRCLQGRLRRTGDGAWRKWCCSLGNQFVPPLIGCFALPLWEFQAMGFQVSTVLEEAAPLQPMFLQTAQAPQESLLLSATFRFPFLPLSGFPAPLYTQAPFIMGLEVELSPTPLL